MTAVSHGILHHTREQHDADPPAAWQVVKHGAHSYILHSRLVGALGYFTSPRDARIAKGRGPLVDAYRRDSGTLR